ncbi:hypothetical protein FJU08_22060 [Martelella alba]|uniref:Uncharacterized protein n=1 Tax=Martelella alba TaxID=2590451 RepID=A0A506U022_9HYPH|nr:hypothetical protein [Martelella alba]TPW26561.1 hypothetical protein FJU08_22060 [Martelella alba]
MKCGILIIGSLYWDEENGRTDWRKRRLDMSASIPVRAPIYYGRKSTSRGNTYTMTFRRNDPSGMAILVPCQREIETIDDLKDEVEALWKAEAPNSRSGAIGSAWGCVGALLGSDESREALAQAWYAHFRTFRTEGLSVVDADGILDIVWPETENGAPADMDVILATATKPIPVPPRAHSVADAWLSQSGGYERYFLENVRHGIRTFDDGEIWQRIEERAPHWLNSEGYALAIQTLRAEAAGHE